MIEHAALLLNNCFIILSQGHVDRHLQVCVFTRFLLDLLETLRLDVCLRVLPIPLAKTLPVWFELGRCLNL